MKVVNHLKLYKIDLSSECEELCRTLLGLFFSKHTRKLHISERYNELRPKLFEFIHKRYVLAQIRQIAITCFYYHPMNADHLGMIFSQDKPLNPISNSVSDFLDDSYIGMIEKELGLKLKYPRTIYDAIARKTTKGLVIIKEIHSDLVFFQYPNLTADQTVCSIEKNEIVITQEFRKKFMGDKKFTKQQFVKNKEGDLVGFKGGCNFWCFNLRDHEPLLLPDSRWNLLKNHFTNLCPDQNMQYRDNVPITKTDFRNLSFTAMLTSLKKWYFVDIDTYEQLEQTYKELFEKNLAVNGINKYKGVDFITLENNNGTILGSYNDGKTGEEGDNLEFWICGSGTQNDVYPRCDRSRTINQNIVYSLKPSVSYYLLKCFGEDFIESILQDLKENQIISDYLHNIRLSLLVSNSEPEVDFLVFTTSKRIVKIEVKRTISEFNIREQLQKDERIHNSDYKSSKLLDQYLMIGFQKDSSCSSAYHYFISESDGDSDLDIEIPLFGSQDKKTLHCISGSSFDQLKTRLTEVFSE